MLYTRLSHLYLISDRIDIGINILENHLKNLIQNDENYSARLYILQKLSDVHFDLQRYTESEVYKRQMYELVKSDPDLKKIEITVLNDIATIYWETKQDEKAKKIYEFLKNEEIKIRTRSKYLYTDDYGFIFDQGIFKFYINLSHRKNLTQTENTKLKEGSYLVLKLSSNINEKEHFDLQLNHTITDSDITNIQPTPIAIENKIGSCLFADIEIYEDSTKKVKLGSHHQLIKIGEESVQQ